jgi:predicted nucleic acid-binding protein
MIAYVDTSVLVKKYGEEEGSGQFARLWRTDARMGISAVGYAEAVAAFHRKLREGSISRERMGSMLRSLRGDWGTFIVVDVSGLLHPFLDHLLSSYPLRGFDAVHLASAMILARLLEEDVAFFSADIRLTRAAQSEGLRTTL